MNADEARAKTLEARADPEVRAAAHARCRRHALRGSSHALLAVGSALGGYVMACESKAFLFCFYCAALVYALHGAYWNVRLWRVDNAIRRGPP